MKIPTHYKRIMEHPESFELHDERDGRSFHVAKAGLEQPMLKQMSQLPAYADGGDIAVDLNPTLPQNLVSSSDASLDAQRQQIEASNQSPPEMPSGNPFTGHYAGTDELKNIARQQLEAEKTNAIPDSSTPAPSISAAPNAPSAPQLPDLTGAGQEEIQAMKAGAAAESKQAGQTAQAWEQYNKDVSAMPTATDVFHSHQAKDEALQNAFASEKIDPNRYWHSQNTGQKISAGLEYAFSVRSERLKPEHRNYAMNAIQSSIDRDIDAQKEDKSNALNLWKMNRQATQDEMQATAATQNQMYSGVLAKAQQYAAQAGGPMAMPKIAPQIAEIKNRMARNNMFMSMKTVTRSKAMRLRLIKMNVLQMVNPKNA